MMNYQIFKKHELIDWLISLANSKGGLIITENQLFSVIKDRNLLEKLNKNKKSFVSVNEIEFEEFPIILLSSIGTISCCDPILVFNNLYKKYNSFNQKQEEILKRFIEFLKNELNKNTKKICLYDFLESIIQNDELSYISFAIDVINCFVEHYISSPYSLQAKYPKNNVVSLDDLFENEKSNLKTGEYFDQRYIDYLYKNFGDLSKIHWRKFEELTAQFFQNEGYIVEISRGRKDGGIDVIAKKDENILLIQCKRWKNAVDVNTIKVLHDDVTYNDAKAGVLVSIHGVSRDAKRIIKNRNYKISIIDQNEIFEMLGKYKSTF